MTILQTQTARAAQTDVPSAASPDVRDETQAREADASRDALTRIMKAAGAQESSPPKPVGTMTLGRVTDAGPAAGDWRIALPSGAVLTAQTALSCLVQPQRDDLVQLYVDHGRCWVLAILERCTESQALTLDFGAAHVVVEAHDLRLHARDGMTLEAAHLASRADVITQAAAERQAHIGGTDATHAGNTLVHTERHMGLHAKSAVITSASLLKIDGGQIHLG
jgi:hypothetical protein